MAAAGTEGSVQPVRSQSSAMAKSTGRTLPKCLILHTGGTLGMDPHVLQGSPAASVTEGRHSPSSVPSAGLRPAAMLANVLSVVPELQQLSDVSLEVCFNKDSSRVGPAEWAQIAKVLHDNRDHYDGFLVIHGTDTLAYTASALSLMLRGFSKPVVLTGSQLPLAAPRTDARQNLLDSITCVTAAHSPPFIQLSEVAVCFGGRLMRGNRTRKVHSMLYQAFDSPGYPCLAQLGIDVLEAQVMRVPVVPGLDPCAAYGDAAGRGLRGIVLEVFGVGNIPDLPEMGWIPWLTEQMDKGIKVLVVSQCAAGPLHQDMYAAGKALSSLTRQHPNTEVHEGVSITGSMSRSRPHASTQNGTMTPECAVVKLMLVLANPHLSLEESWAGEI